MHVFAFLTCCQRLSLGCFFVKSRNLRLVARTFLESSHYDLSEGNFLGARGSLYGAEGPVKVEK